jgi:4-alpha-glucanotransferase
MATATTPRTAGVLLHPTSLPGPYGIGDLGPTAYAWVEALARAKQKWWQVLPLGPTGFGDSPYQSFSSFAGNQYLLSPESLLNDGLLDRSDIDGQRFPVDRVDYGPVIQFKLRILDRAWQNFKAGRGAHLRANLDKFSSQQASWLEDYALFMALKDSHGGASWQQWPAPLVQREQGALRQARERLADAVSSYRFRQFLFAHQWFYLKKHANEKGIRLIGDVPIFVSSDSADVWANAELFQLDAQRRPTVVAGVPPDYFSATGQLWGNPLYDWKKLQQTNFAWWVARLRATLQQVDIVRLDHFRGFDAYWEIPAGKPTAEIGQWVKAPGTALMRTLQAELGSLPLIAEDLGVITLEVEALRDQFHLPGMRILQFAFGGQTESRFLPHNYDHNTVVYTGTHDNDTTRGWYATIPDGERHFLHRYLGRQTHDVSWDLIRMAWSSVADLAIAPLQDVLDLGTDARMNLPGRPAGNWGWRFREGAFHQGLVDRLRDLTELYTR